MTRFRAAIASTLFAASVLSSGPVMAQSQGRDLFDVAKQAKADGLYQFAKRNFETFLKQNKQSELKYEALVHLGECAYQLKFYDLAIQHFDKVVQGSESQPWIDMATYWRGRAYYRTGKFDKAESDLKEVLAPLINRKDIHPNLLFVLGHAQHELGSEKPTYYRGARSSFESMIKTYPEHPDVPKAYFMIGRGYYKQKKFEEAAKQFTTFTQKFSQHAWAPRAYFFLGEAEYNLFRWKQSADAYQAILSHPKATEQLKSEALYSQGWALDKGNDYAASLSAFLRFKETDPSKPKKKEDPNLIELVNFKIGELYFKMGQYEKADIFFTKLTANAIYGRRAMLWLANSLYQQKHYKEAIGFFDQLLTNEKDPLYSEALWRKGYCLIELKAWPDAMSLFNKAHDLTRSVATKVECQEALALIETRRGKINDAINRYKKLLDDYGDKIRRDKYNYLLGKLYTMQGTQDSYDEAQKKFFWVIQHFPLKEYAVKAQFSIGDALMHQGRYPQALEAYEQVHTMNNATPQQKEHARLNAGIAQYNLQRYEEALEEFERLLKEYPKGEKGFEAHTNIINAQKALKQHTNIVKSYETLLSAYPKHEQIDDALNEYGEYYRGLDMYVEARVQFRRLIDEYPDSPLVDNAWYAIGHCALAIKKPKVALDAWNKLTSNPNGPFFYRTMRDIVALHINQGEYNIALRKTNQFLKRVKAQGQKQALLLLEGRIFQHKRDYRNAINSYKRVIAFAKPKEKSLATAENPARMRAEIELGHCYVSLDDRDYENAVQHYLNALYLYNMPPAQKQTISLEAAKAFVAMKQHQQAKTLLQKFFTDNLDSHPDVKALLATIQAAQGK